VLGPLPWSKQREVGGWFKPPAWQCPRCRGLYCERCPKRAVGSWFKKPGCPECRIELAEVSHARSVHGTNESAPAFKEPADEPRRPTLSVNYPCRRSAAWHPSGPEEVFLPPTRGGASDTGRRGGSWHSPCSAAERDTRLHESTALEVVYSATAREQSKRDGDSIAIPRRAGF